ncbi:uncharacterized protein LOC117106844 isoform X3 [Anneissia japonica]|uniref:uncharacterized protein LOC117106844 isoform X3 n=1 Tax=Anneissia japonica TaxID=1529436 RepID=UPI0014256398|nr:uncharacterized protein LOC117106844 isoform X3 [Anneissia japonica]
MAEQDSGQVNSSSYAEWWRYYCQYAQHAQAAQAQQTQGQASTYSTSTTTAEQETYQVNYSAYQPSYSQVPLTSTVTTTNSYKEANKEGSDYYASSYGYYSAVPSGVEHNKVQEATANYSSADGVGSYANDNAQNAQLENLQKLVAQSVAEAVLKECAENFSQQPKFDKMLPDMEYDRSRRWEGSWRGRGGRGRGKNGHSYFDNRHQRRDYHNKDDGYWNKRKFNDGVGDNFHPRRPDGGHGFSPGRHPRDAFRSNRYDGSNPGMDKSPFHVRPLGPSNPAAVVQQQIEMMMKGEKNKRPRVYAPPPKSLTSQIYNAMKHPMSDKLKTGENKNEEKDPSKNDDTQQNQESTGSKEDDETESSLPLGYDPEKKYGEDYIQEVKAFHCHLCGVLLRWKSEVEEHVKTISHYRVFRNCEECKNTDSKEVLSSENEENKQVEQVSEENTESKGQNEMCGEIKEPAKQDLSTSN